jgi:hypothetical protein
MTQMSELDRALGDWLADGPNRAPDQPILAAARFARAHPRRPDPLRILRSDPMADRRRPSLAMRPALLFAVLGLILAVVAAMVIGSRQSEPSIVPPSQAATSSLPPTASASPDGSPTASTGPSASPPPAAPLLHVDLASTCCPGNPPSLDVADLSGLVVSATSALPLESDSVDGIVVKNAGANSLRITWIGSPCDTIHRLTVDATATHIVLERPRCFGDAIPRFLSVTLTFERSVVASAVRASIADGTGAAGALPNWTVDGGDTAGHPFLVAIYDATGTVTSAEATVSEGGAPLAPNTGRIEGTPPDTIVITWSRSACARNERLTIDPTERVLTMTGTRCSPSNPSFERQLTLRFATPVAATQLLLFVDLESPA